MRLSSVAFAAFALGSMAAVAFAQPPEIVPYGHYYRLAPRTVKGRTIWPRVNDTVAIARVPGGNALVKLDLALDDAACSFAGIARFEGTELVYRDLQADPNGACQIVFSAEPGRLNWSDNGRCTARCPSGALTGHVPLRNRVAGATAARIEGYQAAMAEWRSAAR